jgi:hypothetical protein
MDYYVQVEKTIYHKWAQRTREISFLTREHKSISSRNRLMFCLLSPSQRRGALFRALTRGEGTNSARLFTLGERNALAKSKVHQISWAHGYDPRVDLLTDLKNMAVYQEWDNHTEDISKISIFKSIYLENHVSHNDLWSKFCLKKWEELIYYGKSWNIGQVRFECLMFMIMNFVALIIYCVKHALLFSFTKKL